MLVDLHAFLGEFTLENIRVLVSTTSRRMDNISCQIILSNEVEKVVDLV